MEPQWRDLVKVIIITIIVGIIIYAIQYTLAITAPLLVWSWVGWLNIITVVIFLILIYRWAKKHKYI